MSVYEYRGLNAKGKQVKGLKEADTKKSLRALLRKEGIMVTDVKEAGGKALKKKGKVFFLLKCSSDKLFKGFR